MKISISGAEFHENMDISGRGWKCGIMYQRIIDLRPTLKRKSLFLLGPRQTGKSTYLKSHFPKALYINLLKSSEFQTYSGNPGRLAEVVQYFTEHHQERIVIIDEIQKVPALLDEVHELIETHKSLRFILTGSSARKLKSSGANLLGGRASRFHLYPLCYPELGRGSFKKWLRRLSIGALPSVTDSESPFEDLQDYVGLYLREEIAAEGLTRSIENFSRFLDFAALCNGQQINFTSLGSDAQLAPSTVRSYFSILQDTLVGHLLPAFRETHKRKAMTTAKFYLFDDGVVNAILGRRAVAEGTPEYGQMLEQAIFIEIKAYLDYKRSEKRVEYWRSTSQFEIDFLVYGQTQNIVGIEVKAGANPTRKDFKGLLAFEEEFKLDRKIVVCRTPRPRKSAEGVEVISIKDFLEQLWDGKII